MRGRSSGRRDQWPGWRTPPGPLGCPFHDLALHGVVHLGAQPVWPRHRVWDRPIPNRSVDIGPPRVVGSVRRCPSARRRAPCRIPRQHEADGHRDGPDRTQGTPDPVVVCHRLRLGRGPPDEPVPGRLVSERVHAVLHDAVLPMEVTWVHWVPPPKPAARAGAVNVHACVSTPTRFSSGSLVGSSVLHRGTGPPGRSQRTSWWVARVASGARHGSHAPSRPSPDPRDHARRDRRRPRHRGPAGAAAASSTDPDKDGLPSAWEVTSVAHESQEEGHGQGRPPRRQGGSPDKDTLNNRQEYLAGTRPRRADSDRDGIRDDKEDTDKDGLKTKFEFTAGTKPKVKDSDKDGLRDDRENPDKDGLTNRSEQTPRRASARTPTPTATATRTAARSRTARIPSMPPAIRSRHRRAPCRPCRGPPDCSVFPPTTSGTSGSTTATSHRTPRR